MIPPAMGPRARAASVVPSGPRLAEGLAPPWWFYCAPKVGDPAFAHGGWQRADGAAGVWASDVRAGFCFGLPSRIGVGYSRVRDSERTTVLEAMELADARLGPPALLAGYERVMQTASDCMFARADGSGRAVWRLRGGWYHGRQHSLGASADNPSAPLASLAEALAALGAAQIELEPYAPADFSEVMAMLDALPAAPAEPLAASRYPGWVWSEGVLGYEHESGVRVYERGRAWVSSRDPNHFWESPARAMACGLGYVVREGMWLKPSGGSRSYWTWEREDDACDDRSITTAEEAALDALAHDYMTRKKGRR